MDLLLNWDKIGIVLEFYPYLQIPTYFEYL
jgi:hypothetical protein